MARGVADDRQPTPTLFDKLAAGGISSLRSGGLSDSGRLDVGQVDPVSTGLIPSVSQLERFNESALRATVRRDLGWLLNTVRLEEVIDLSPWPNVRTSVLNFGIPEVAGRVSEQLRIDKREREFRDAILTFEPRILPSSLKVKGSRSEDDRKTAQMEFRIEGNIAAAVDVLPVEYRTKIDLETGDAAIQEERR